LVKRTVVQATNHLSRRNTQNQFDPATIWAGFAALAILVAALAIIGVFTGGNTQTTSTPAMETTGSALPHSEKRQY
jgi:hypothetical protein